MNLIKRPLAHNLGFDEFNQLNVCWEENGSLYSTIIADMRDKTCAICGRQWEVTAESFRNQFYAHELELWMHKTCFHGYLSIAQATKFSDLICAARDEQWKGLKWEWKRIPNEYGGGWQTPWYRVSFPDFKPWMKIGARKRVFHMSMHDLTEAQINLFNLLVTAEDVTKGSETGSVYIHAWGYDVMRKYLDYFLKVLALDKPAGKPAEVAA